MSWLLGGGQAQAAQAPAASGLSAQTSAYGKCINLAYGTPRLAPNLIWYGDFVATAHQQSGGKGGIAGGGGGKGGGGGVNYTYTTAVQMGLCEGPIQNILTVYKDKALTTTAALGMTTALGGYPQAPWGYLTTNHGFINQTSTIPATPYQVQTTYHTPFLVDNGVITNVTLVQKTTAPTLSQYNVSHVNNTYVYLFNSARAGENVTFTYSINIGTFFSPSYTTLQDVQTIPASAPFQIITKYLATSAKVLNLAYTAVPSSPAVNQYSIDTATGIYTFNSANAAEVVTISYAAGDQIPAFEDLGYNGVAWVAASAYDLGNSPSLSNHNFEVQAAFADLINKISAPGTPSLSSVASGALGATTYYVVTTWVNANGETIPSAESSQVTTASHVVKVAAPTGAPTGATGWNVYVSNTAQGGSTHETQQNLTVNTLGVDWQMPNSGLIHGNAQPLVNSTGLPDADPTLIIADFLTNNKYGAGFPAAFLDPMTNYQDYVLASGLLMSFVLDTQQSAASTLEAMALATNSEWVWIGGLLTLVPYGDAAITGNGHTYTPPAAPLYDLTDDDFIPQSDGDPVQRQRKRPTDLLNWIQMEYTNRANNYNVAIAEWKNSAIIDLYKLRPQTPSSSTLHLFATGDIANHSIQLLGQRQVILNTYTFTTDQRYIVLDPMDIVTLTDAKLGLNQTSVRIKKITENSDNTLTFDAEDYLAGIGSTPLYGFQSSVGFSADYNTPPGDTNTPIIFEAPVQIATNTGLETWLLASGSDANWGGCQVFVSTDGNSYNPLPNNTINGQGRMGVSVGSFYGNFNQTLRVDLTESKGQLLSGTDQDLAQGNTLCYLGGELLAYSSAVLVSPYVYDLTMAFPYPGGLYGTGTEVHPSGTSFGRLDKQVFSFPYDKTQIGQNIYVKLLSFNLFGGGGQNLSDVDPYIHTIIGPPIPPDVATFTGAQVDNSVAFQWSSVDDFALKGYHILYGIQGAGIGSATYLTQATRGTEMTNAAVLPGCWTFYIIAVDIADQVSVTPAQFDLCVTNKNIVVATDIEAPDWINTSSYFDVNNFIKHWSGVIIPTSASVASDYETLAAPAAPTLYTVPGGALGPRTYFVTVSYIVVYPSGTEETLCSAETSIVVPAGYLLGVTSPPTPPDYILEPPIPTFKYNVYVSQTSGAETLQSVMPTTQGGDWQEPLSGLISGVSMPTQNLTGFYPFDFFVPNPSQTNRGYFATTIDVGFDANVRIWADISLQLGPGETGFQQAVFSLAVTPNGDTPPVHNLFYYTPWIIQYTTGRYFGGAISFTTPLVEGNVPFFSKFNVVIDGATSTTEYDNFSVGGGGSTLTFDQQYTTPPSVQVTPTDGITTGGNATSVTTTNCVINLFVGSTPTAGTANVTVKGV